ncbi:hypothetical protein BO70DRAFT_376882 [Aspergillus heteromorphus CBS 117.55]|uniref:Uncharacterized protein n=1 Tax=Aspergillus heteromorphus CBS 117.55 TaxID=1448321 RepID=A0A317WYU4_9EURO|nr:uncharacterized protein BO70DRAFT_376882 [Aspergillus heteromorphus CBS 117.55]PWY91131.1 hypothetical protein BO70DRAFT_376882 [Aspergillus heteromorphus CBS 117.55]
MSERLSRPSSPYLEPPRTSVDLEDPRAHDSATNSDDEHFSDASEGHERAPSQPPSGRASPIPLTRVEKVDEDPSHGEVPGTAAYEVREQDAVPDQIEVIPEGSRSRSASATEQQRPLTPNSPIPRTVVEKVDLDQPSHGDVPGTPAYELRKADAVPDVVMTAADSDDTTTSDPIPGSFETEPSVPETVLSRVDSDESKQPNPSDAEPDQTHVVPDTPDSPSSHRSHASREPSVNDEANEEEDEEAADPPAADDFDDFGEEQAGDDDDDFGDFDDFDDDFEEPTEAAEAEPADIQASQPPTPPSVPPILDLSSIPSLSSLQSILASPLDRLFPSTTDTATLPPLDPIPNPTAIFNTERSLSLWSQLVAPPPLQPQNWVKSRIRRLFLVSLGVPVDLDEILPASKQKKLILPSVNPDHDHHHHHLPSTPTTNTNPAHSRSQSTAANRDSTSSPGPNHPTSTAAKRTSTRRREPSPPPDLDLPSVRRLCTTTDAALEGFTDGELRGHVGELETVTLRASSVLEYWLKRLDGLVSEKEAFEGVIENLEVRIEEVRIDNSSMIDRSTAVPNASSSSSSSFYAYAYT